jgi:CRISPR-associated endonuclease/helicase Cas3
MSENEALFARIAGLKQGESPYPHQIETFQHLRNGQSVLLHAPTGSGKSEAAFVPFLALRGHGDFPSRLLYALPMRTLVDSLADRFHRMSERQSVPIRVTAQHGRRPESVLFYADAVVATIDQIITSYACAPLSLGVRHGNIPAGAVAGSFLIFDEVHTFDPERALQAMLLIAGRLRQMDVPVVLMTATLPKEARELLCERLNLTPVEIDENKIRVRAKRQVSLQLKLEQELTPHEVRQALEASSGRILVVCNTVDRAIALYRALQNETPSPLLLHSRFLDDDRKGHDERIQALLGKNERQPALVIATQVVEVGLDISCDVLLTELCPIDALLQRAGRCARWAEAMGEIVVYGLPKGGQGELAAPYDSEIVQETARALEEAYGARLTWTLEQQFVDQVLGRRYAAWLEPQRAATVAHKLASAAFTGNRRDAEEAVREADSAEISLHTRPTSLRGRLRFLPRISVSAGLVRRFAAQHPESVWSVEVDSRVTGDESRGLEVLESVNSPKDIRFGRLYILSSNVSYSKDTGLAFEGSGEDWEPLIAPARGDLPGGRPRLETMEEHLKGALECFRKIVASREGYALKRAAALVSLPVEEAEKLLAVALLCHDLGKASEAWQRAAWQTVDLWLKEDPENIESLTKEERQLLDGDTGATFLARFPSLGDRSREPGRPAHATVSAYVMWNFLRQRWHNWGIAAALAMAHHHSVRANHVPRYRLKGGWFDLFQTLLKEEAGVELDTAAVERVLEQRSETQLPSPTIPPFHQEKQYALYLVLSRCLSLSDRMAAGGGEDAILDYKKWAGNL